MGTGHLLLLLASSSSSMHTDNRDQSIYMPNVHTTRVSTLRRSTWVNIYFTLS